MPIEHFDVVIVGAGLSGIGAGYHLQANCPRKSYVILEGRTASGGTWDLFRYPGIRSDSDMYTLGYSFRPWTEAKAIADGPSILKYVRETARDHGIDTHIRFNTRVTRASWSTAESRWTVEAERGPGKEVVRYTCNFLFMCSGYYKYEAGHRPAFPNEERFGGRIVHPQHWPQDLDTSCKRIVVVGSGATAVTLVPELARTAAHVTMLQRSPTYIVSRPAVDDAALKLNARLPARMAYAITRWKNVLRGMYVYRLCKTKPDKIKAFIIDEARKALPPGYDVEKHFTPRYKPWDQRVCLVPDGDLFTAIRDGKASVVTDTIESFTASGIKLKSGEELVADLIVTATGLDLQPLGALELTVDGKPVEISKLLNYKGMMYSEVPNLASAIGYTNASWTLKCDLTCEYVCRLLNHMNQHGYSQCTPRRSDPSVVEEPWVDFTSGYVQRAASRFPKQGSKKPWRLHQNYARDIVALRYGKLEDGTMEFRKRAPVEQPARETQAA